MNPTHLAKEIESLVKRGKKLKPKDLYVISSIKENPIAPFLLNRYTEDGNLLLKDLLVDLQNFVKGIDMNYKLSFLFKIYDYNKNGEITNAELFKLLEAITGSKDVRSLQNLVDKVFLKLDEFKHTMNEEEFLKIVNIKNKNLKKFFICDDKFFKL
ncbi:hypothetical protein H311_03701 [Anncaliia algerae PRA109]|uniref:Calcineurin subunit B n=1 Tax=Anncaliia algerae PRA339 TaxID=1288291 RepID=A0A059EYW6_9MICR|nr:hypothetical protein H311_03701 [Anncaliia algerae PRA109]KCZ80248.1 hypothetical protein H312_02338 [Anncaliia algerae PRA339]